MRVRRKMHVFLVKQMHEKLYIILEKSQVSPSGTSQCHMQELEVEPQPCCHRLSVGFRLLCANKEKEKLA